MGEQIFWEDVTEGMELPDLVKQPTTRQLVMYAGASGDYYEIHYDKEFAQGNNLDGPILHGALKNAFLGQLMTGWMGPLGTLKRLSCQYRGMDFPGQDIILSYLTPPLAIQVDFTFKDAKFTKKMSKTIYLHGSLWNKYMRDSLTGPP